MRQGVHILQNRIILGISMGNILVYLLELMLVEG